jgi:outer membrane lipoprotein-sorting protein
MKFISAMKASTMTAAVLAGVMSFGALAAQEISKEEATKYEKVGTVNTTAEATSPMDAKEELSKLADEKGGKYFVVIAGREHGKVSAIAEVYK